MRGPVWEKEKSDLLNQLKEDKSELERFKGASEKQLSDSRVEYAVLIQEKNALDKKNKELALKIEELTQENLSLNKSLNQKEEKMVPLVNLRQKFNQERSGLLSKVSEFKQEASLNKKKADEFNREYQALKTDYQGNDMGCGRLADNRFVIIITGLSYSDWC